MKILVVSAWAPPMGGGSPIALGRRLRALPEGSYAILTAERRAFSRVTGEEWLPARYFFLGEELTPRPIQGEGSMDRARASARALPGLVLQLLRLGRDLYHLSVRRAAVRRRVVRLIQQERPDAILAASDDGVFVIAAYQAARATATPLYVLMLDIYAENNYSFLKRLVARLYERRILEQAKRVFVTNTRTRTHYRSRYSVDPVVVEHAAPRVKQKHARKISRDPVIAYTGSIYWAQQDAIKRLIEALRLLPRIRLRLLTEQSEADLRRRNLVSERVSLSSSGPSNALEWQAGADILFLPLSFTNSAPAVIRTAAPGKMAEYLVSGVPILVHAPPDSFISLDAREFGWGLVVDRPNTQALADAIRKLLADYDLREELVAKAFGLARARHDEGRIADRFRRELGFPAA